MTKKNRRENSLNDWENQVPEERRENCEEKNFKRNNSLKCIKHVENYHLID